MSVGKARYKKILYKGRQQSNGMVLLTTYNENEAEGFEKKIYPDGHFIYFKYVAKAELEELYEEREYGTWNDMEFELDGGAPKGWYTIWFGTGDYKRDAEKINKIESLGMKIVEPGLWRIEVPKSSLTNYHIKRIDLLNK